MSTDDTNDYISQKALVYTLIQAYNAWVGVCSSLSPICGRDESEFHNPLFNPCIMNYKLNSRLLWLSIALLFAVAFFSSCASTTYTSSTYRHHNHGTCAAYQTPAPWVKKHVVSHCISLTGMHCLTLSMAWPEQADRHRIHVTSLSDTLYESEISERVAYGLGIAALICSVLLDLESEFTFLWYLLKFALYGALITTTVLCYTRRMARIKCEKQYYRTILGKAYRE